MAFSAQIEANISNFTKNLDKATQDISKFQDNVAKKLDRVGDSFIKVGKSASIFSGVVAGVVTGLSALATSTAQTAKDLGSLSVITGASTDTLQEYALITAKATVPTDTLATATLNLQRRLRDTSEEGAGASKVLREMGVSFKNLDGSVKSSSQITEEAIKAFAKLEDGIEKSSKGTLVFGGQWQNIAQIADLGADAIDNLKQEAHDLGLVMSEDAINKSADFGIALDVLKLRVTALKNQIGTSLAPMLTDTLLPIIENQIMPAVKRFADFIKNLIDRFNELSPATKTLIASMTGIAIALGPTLVAIGGLLKLLPLIGAGFTALTGPVGIAIAGIVAGAVLIVKNWDNIKEYFTNGGGSELFKSIKALSSNLFDALKTTFNNIKNVVLKVWDSIGSNVIRQLSLVIDTVVKSLTFVANIINDFLNILRSEPKDVLENLKTFFVNAFTGILDIVKNVLASVTNQLSGFFRLLKLDKWADSLTSFSEKLAPIKEKVQENSKATEKAIPLTEALTVALDKQGGTAEYISPQIAKLSAEYLKLNKSLEGVTANMGGERIGNFNIGGTEMDLGVSPIINLNVEGLSEQMKAMRDVVFTNLRTLKDEAQTLTLDLGEMLSGGISNAMQGLGNALANGDNMMGALGGAIISTLGNLAQQVGAMMITFGVGAMKLKLMLANPFATIAAGAALVALGSLAVSSVNSAMNSGIGGGGYSGGGGYQSSRVDAPMQQGEFQYRDSYSQQQVEFKISGDSLVGVLDKKQTRNNRNV